ncbi:MAG: DUF2279 domain-containing protein [Cyclobacteriaceae bacterium]
MKLNLLPGNNFFLLAFILLYFIFNPSYLVAQVYKKDSLNHTKLRNLVIGSVAGNAIIMTALGTIWYADQPSQPFHFFDDSKEWKQMDKMGHLQSTYHLSNFYFNRLQKIGVEKNKANFWGSLTGFLLISQIEVFDGFSAGYGASWSDLGFNAVGSLLAFGQHYFLEKPLINPKFSFSRTSYAPLRPELLGNGWHEEWLKDYNGQTIWFSFDLHQIIKPCPKWLNLALGYGAQSMVSADDNTNLSLGYDPYRQYYLSIDFDFSYLKSRSSLLNALIYFVNMVHLPAPALEYNRVSGLNFHWFYF